MQGVISTKASEESMLICRKHQYYKVPLISTFAFPRAEYWCPFCGSTEGVFGAGEIVTASKSLKEKGLAYYKLARPYLRAVGRRSCFETLHNGKRVKPSELPQRVKTRDANIIAGWKNRQRVKP